MNERILAIDPGASGGFAYSCDNDDVITCAMPETDGDTLAYLKGVKSEGVEVAYMEKVGGYIGGAKFPGSAMFRFGYSNGVLVGILMALGFRVELVTPQTWQKRLGLGTRQAAGSKSEWKRKLKAEAQRRFPLMTVTLKTADALLILDWARSNHQPKEA